MNVRFCLFVCLPVLAYSSVIPPVGPYWIKFNRFEKCPREGNKEITLDFHLRKMNRTTVVLYGNMSMKQNLDNSIKVTTECSQWGNGGWRPNHYSFTFDGNICKNLYNIYLGKAYEILMAKAGVTFNKTNCVTPRGNYQVDDLVVSNLQYKPLPVMIFGSYRATLSFYSAQDELLGCVRLVFGVQRR